MLLRVGRSSFQGDITRYAKHFNLVEVRAEPGTLPRTARLRQWREQVGEDFTFSVVLSAAVGLLEAGPELDSGLAYSLQVAEALGATWLLLQTPQRVTPSQRTERRLNALLPRLPLDRIRLAWEPHGVWQPDSEERVAQPLGLHLVRDARRADLPAGPIVYTRLRGLGLGARFGAAAAEGVAEHVLGRSEAFVVIEGTGSVQGAAALRRLLEEGSEDQGSSDEP